MVTCQSTGPTPWVPSHAVALSGLPSFRDTPNTSSEPHPHHQCSIHINCASTDMVEAAYQEAVVHGRASTR